jgi:hypothetical protein
MLAPHEIESLRRSHAMAPLGPADVTTLLETCAELARRQAAVVEVLDGLPASFSAVRSALNRLHDIVR